MRNLHIWNDTRSDEEMLKYIRSPSYRGSDDNEFNLSRRKKIIMIGTFQESVYDDRYNTDIEFNGEDLKRLARIMNYKLSSQKLYDLALNHIDVLFEEFTKNDHKLSPLREQRHQYLRKNSSRKSTVIRHVRRSMEIVASHAGVACELSRILGLYQIGNIEWLENKFKVLINTLEKLDEKLYQTAAKSGGYVLEEDYYIKEEWSPKMRVEELDYRKKDNIYIMKSIFDLQSILGEAVGYGESTYYIRLIIDVIAGYRHSFLIVNRCWKHQLMHNVIRTLLYIGFHKTNNGINALTKAMPNADYVSKEGLIHEVNFEDTLLGLKFPEDMETLEKICSRVDPHMPIYSYISNITHGC